MTGLTFFTVAVVSLGIALTSGRRTWLRIVAGIGTFVVGFGFSLLVDAIVVALHSGNGDRHWVWAEFNL